MATSRVCSIPDCGKPAKARGWCRGHYGRWREYGDPNSGRITRGTAVLEIDRALASAGPDECWAWPHAKGVDGRGRVRVNGKLACAARLVCERRHGPPPTPRHYAIHRCGNGHLGCINPHHLRWGTPAENSADAIAHGTFVRGSRHQLAKLTESQVTEIRRRYSNGGVLQRELAAEFGVSREQARDVINGKKWGWMSNYVEPPVTNRTRRVRSKAPKSAFGPVAK